MRPEAKGHEGLVGGAVYLAAAIHAADFSTSTVMQVESFVDEHAISKEPPAATIVGVEVAALELVTPDVSVVLEQAVAVNARRMLAVSAYAFSLFLLREGQCHP